MLLDAGTTLTADVKSRQFAYGLERRRPACNAAKQRQTASHALQALLSRHQTIVFGGGNALKWEIVVDGQTLDAAVAALQAGRLRSSPLARRRLSNACVPVR